MFIKNIQQWLGGWLLSGNGWWGYSLLLIVSGQIFRLKKCSTSLKPEHGGPRRTVMVTATTTDNRRPSPWGDKWRTYLNKKLLGYTMMYWYTGSAGFVGIFPAVLWQVRSCLYNTRLPPVGLLGVSHGTPTLAAHIYTEKYVVTYVIINISHVRQIR